MSKVASMFLYYSKYQSLLRKRFVAIEIIQAISCLKTLVTYV